MNAPLVLVHGMLGAPASFDALRAQLGARELDALTLPGHTHHPRPVPTSFEAAADELAAELAVRYGDVPVDLLGYSLGARLTLAVCARHPARFRRAILVSVHPGLTSDDARAARRAEDEACAAQIEREGLATFLDDWETRAIFASQRRLPPVLIAHQRAIRLAQDPRGIAAAFRGLGLAQMPPLADALVALAPRLRLVVGALDTKFCAIAAALAQRAPMLAIDVLPGVGHNCILEAPALLAARIAPFLSAAARAA